MAASLESWETRWLDSTLVAETDGRLVGFLGAELDESLSRVWLYGPLVESTDWSAVADGLLAALLAAVPSAVAKDQELVGDVANERLAMFAARHGFAAGEVHHVLSLPAAGIARLPEVDLPGIAAQHRQTFCTLHNELFPGTYFSAQQLLDQAAEGKATILGLVPDGDLVGYAAGRINEEGAGYVDFIGVTPARRREGHGRALVVAIARALQATHPIPQVSLTVSSENAAALALYDALGFERTSSAIGYRRHPELRA